MIKMTSNLITPSLNQKIKQLDALPKGAFDIFHSHTPIKTGNARSKTKLKNETIHANYPYAKPLEKGRSRQAPDGMSKPTLAYVKKTADKTMKRK